MSPDCPPERRCGDHGSNLQRPVCGGRIHSGLAYGAANDMPSAFAAMRQAAEPIAGLFPPTAACPGNYFPRRPRHTVHPNNSGQVLEQAIGTRSTQKTVHRGQIPGGHEYTRTTHTDAGDAKSWSIGISTARPRMVRR